MHLAVIIPCYNEEKTIQNVIHDIPLNIHGVNKTTIIVVDDGSEDNTLQLAKVCGAVVISHHKNLGVGAAFQSGISAALDYNADLIVNIDGDGQFNPKKIKDLVTPIINNNADFVSASRFIDPQYYPEMPRIKFWGNKVMSRIISRITGKRFYDVSCGFRAYSKETTMKLNLFGKYTYTQETFISLAYKNLRILEVPVKIRGVRQFGKSRVASNLFSYAYRTLKIIVKSYRDYQPFKLFGLFGFLWMLIGAGFFVFLLTHYLQVKEFTPYKWTGFAGAFFLLMGFIFYLLGFILEMFTRMRLNQEMMLFQIRRLMSYNGVTNNKN